MFITREDPNAILKGSRDPLGLVPIRTALGRHVISNLNTQSNSARGFTTLILGRYLAQYLIENGDAESEATLDIFLRFEQLSAYARHIGHGVDGEIRGIDRVRANSKQPKKIPIRTDREGKLLTDQKLYGLWGLFSVPARTSQLIDDQSVGVTESTREFIESNYIPTLNPIMKPLSELLTRDGYLNTSKSDAFSALRSIFSTDYTGLEQLFYNEYLCDAPNAHPNPVRHQKLFNQLLREYVERDDSLGRESFELLKAQASSRDGALARRLDQILRIEAILSVSSAVFSHLLSCDRAELTKVAAYLSNKWGKSLPNIDTLKNNDLLDEIEAVYTESEDVKEYFDQCQKSLADGQYSDFIEALVRWNLYISARRGGSPWLVFGSDRRLEVRYRGLDTILPSADDLALLWHNGYFVTSLHSITHQLAQSQN